MIFFSPERLSIRTLNYIGEDYHIKRYDNEDESIYASRVYKEIKDDIQDFIEVIKIGKENIRNENEC